MTATTHTQPIIQQKPLFATIGIHALLLLILVLWRYSKPNAVPPFPEMGMEVNLGTSADGSGNNQPMDRDDPGAIPISLAANSASTSSAANDVERSTNDDGVAIPDVNKNRNQSTANTTTENARRQSANAAATNRNAVAQKPRYVYPGATGRGGNRASTDMPGTSEGNTTGPGDRGVPGGTPGATNYEGVPGNGTGGISSSISGRNIIAYPPNEARFREGGRVVVRVTVDRSGAIVNHQIISSTNTELTPIALRKLAAVRFNKSETAPAEQFGNITFDFKTRQ